MSSIPECDLDAYTRIALPLILSQFPDWEIFATFAPRADNAGNVVEFNVPCPSITAENGLWLSTADEELSVGFHTHHSHFTDYGEGNHVRQIQAGVDLAADYLAERVGVLSWYRNGQFAGSISVDLPHGGPLQGDSSPEHKAIKNLLDGSERMTLRSWLGSYDRDEESVEFR